MDYAPYYTVWPGTPDSTYLMMTLPYGYLTVVYDEEWFGDIYFNYEEESVLICDNIHWLQNWLYFEFDVNTGKLLWDDYEIQGEYTFAVET